MALIDLIKQLRDRTGAGLMDCKAALLNNNEDIEKATDWLREKGLAKAAKKADRIAAEGLALTKTCEKCGKSVVIEVNCETDFVAKGDAFRELVDQTAGLILKNEPKNVEEAKALAQDLFTDATVKMGEKFDLRRFELINQAEGQFVYTYIHMGGKIAVAVVLDKEEAAKQDPKLAGKPEEMLKKIIAGKVNKYFAEMVLVEQPYLLDTESGKKVGQVLQEKKTNVLKYVRYQVGEGIEKRDFASEVMSQVK